MVEGRDAVVITSAQPYLTDFLGKSASTASSGSADFWWQQISSQWVS